MASDITSVSSSAEGGAHLQDQRTTAQADYPPTVRWDRITSWGAGIAVAACLANFVSAKNHDAGISQALRQPYQEVITALEQGKINRLEVVRLTAPEAGSTYGTAASFSQGKGNVLDIVDITSAQYPGNDYRVEPNQPFIVPVEDVAPEVLARAQQSHQK